MRKHNFRATFQNSDLFNDNFKQESELLRVGPGGGEYILNTHGALGCLRIFIKKNPAFKEIFITTEQKATKA